MIVKVLEVREYLRELYSQYDVYMIAVLKFLFTCIVLVSINSNIGYMPMLNNPLIVLGIGLLCSFLPVGIISFVVSISILMHFSVVSMELVITTLIALIAMYCLHFILKTQNSIVMVITLLACLYQMPGAIIVIIGLIFTPVAAIPAGFGVILYTIIMIAKKDVGTIFSTNSSLDVLGKISYFFQNLGNNKTMLLLIGVFILIISFVYVVRRMNIYYAWSFAIGAGSVAYILLILIGSFVLNISVNILLVVGSVLIGSVFSLILYLFVFSLDYTRIEHVQFEDDDYYYFVKAVPKITVTTPEKKVKRINTRKIVHEDQKNEKE